MAFRRQDIYVACTKDGKPVCVQLADDVFKMRCAERKGQIVDWEPIWFSQLPYRCVAQWEDGDYNIMTPTQAKNYNCKILYTFSSSDVRNVGTKI